MKYSALVCIDFINEIINPKGKLAGKGYASFSEERSTLTNVAKALEFFRSRESLIIHVGLAFDSGYISQPKQSPLFGKANEFSILQANTWSTEFTIEAKPIDGEPIVRKPRVSAFFGTPLQTYLQQRAVSEVYFCGVATDLAVESAARDAHDRDYSVSILEECCAAATVADHENSIKLMSKIGKIVKLEELV